MCSVECLFEVACIEPVMSQFNFVTRAKSIIAHWWSVSPILVPVCLHCLSWTKFGQLILKKIIKIVAVSCRILRQKGTKFGFICGSAPDSTVVAHCCPQIWQLDLRGSTSNVREGRERRREGKGGERRKWWEPWFIMGPSFLEGGPIMC